MIGLFGPDFAEGIAAFTARREPKFVEAQSGEVQSGAAQPGEADGQ
jgi:hypothetical protein